jgi:putative beta-lysine N-acetyltransferase
MMSESMAIMMSNHVDGEKREIKGSDYRALIHLSPLNKRLVIKDYSVQDITSLTTRLVKLAEKNDFTKIWVKAKRADQARFAGIGFETEAVIGNYYAGSDAVSMAYYLSENRSKMIAPETEKEIIEKLTDVDTKTNLSLADNYKFELADKNQLKELAKLYSTVFESYPYPIDRVDYLEKMIDEDVIYGLVYEGTNLIAAASAETIPEYKNAEMTDFATLPDYRGQGLARYLLKQLEQVLKERDYNCLYTIARAKIVGVNKIFKQTGYQYRGRLIQNCNIAGGLEDMNLWSKIIK